MILRLIFDDNNWEEDRYYPSSPGVTSVLFTDVAARCAGGSAGRGGENPVIGRLTMVLAGSLSHLKMARLDKN